MRAFFLPRLAFVGALALGVTGCADYPTIPDDQDSDTDDDGDRPGNGNSPGGGLDLGQGGGPTEEPKTEDEYECGNGKLEPGEICDDGNNKNGDGCSKDCLEQDPEFDCSSPGEPCRDTVVCGNGVLEGDEACDDGNKKGSDGCSANCEVVEPGYSCPRPGKDCFLLPQCGNGKLERGEECDDGNDTNPDDGCHECALDEGFFCVPGQACVARVCGDGNRTPDEECDDGPGTLGSPGAPVGNDGCDATCHVEDGYRCGASGCKAICGDGKVLGEEQCDDGERVSGDGCSALCKIEPRYTCNAAEPSVCTKTPTVCGNSVREQGEVCDPPGVDGCLPGCQDFDADVTGGAICGNDKIEYGETCDKPGPGCDAGCQTMPGWTCIRPNQCFANPRCGDGIVHLARGEECDDGDGGGDGCDADCKVEAGWSCSGLTDSVCVQEICGDGIRTPSEECDEGMGTTTAGCVGCTVTEGWACPTAGAPCIERCGDGIKVGSEECDDDNKDNGDGCNAACRVEFGYTCDDDGCVKGVCGDSTIDLGEGCDDGNSIAGDGCSATCQVEPTITRVQTEDYPTPVVNVTCGDGLITGDEAFPGDEDTPAGCDDGNVENGDGCDEDCHVEDGYVCDPQIEYPDFVQMQVTYRDWRADNQNRGHPDFEVDPYGARYGVPGPVCTATANNKCTTGAGVSCSSVANSCGHLDKDGKPVHHLPNSNKVERGTIESASSFATWYRNGTEVTTTTATNDYDNTYNVRDLGTNTNLSRTMVFTESIVLDAVDGSPGTYRFDNDGQQLFPLDGRGLGDYSDGHNFHFTTELQYFFQYQGGETLTFRGDDDVWVFVNGRLAVDIGGVHGKAYGRVILGDDGGIDLPNGDADSNPDGTDSNCSVHRQGSLSDCSLEPAETHPNDTNDTRFGLVKGGVYEIVLFHAERHTSESNFELTLAGFLPPRSYCKPDCGDGEVVGYEVCDDGDDNAEEDEEPASGQCNFDCTARAYCGDGEIQEGEDCDNGANLDLYDTGLEGQCAPGCVLPPSCGDGEIQPAYEFCDNGDLNSDTAWGPTSCNTSCGVGLYCGDELAPPPHDPPYEICDEGLENGTTYGPNSCGYDCGPGPRCGDGIRNGIEQCDTGANNGQPGSICNSNCTFAPHCGDGDVDDGEDCDFGQFADDDQYGGCTTQCLTGPHCGDGDIQEDGGEECDNGVNTDTYDDGTPDLCAEGCILAPGCGDGIVQAGTAEECDNGFNEDTYRLGEDSCGLGCSAVPYCGDGELNSAFEFCDEGTDKNDGRYEGCTAECEFAAYCGDGHTDAPDEACDDGANNTAYSATGQACGYDCQPAPYCGDGERNGPEQCDEGTAKNDGRYGGCKANCTRAPYCGDRKIQAGEACDDGPTGSLNCSTACQLRSVIR